MALIADLFAPEGLGMPDPWVIAAILLVVLALAVAIDRDVRHARYGLVWVVAFAIPLAIREPFLTQKTAMATLAPALLAALICGPRTVLAAAVTPIAILTLRVPGHSPYLNPGYLLIYAVLVALVIGVQRTMLSAMEHATKSSALFDALARETNEIITIAGPGKDGDDAGVHFVSPSVTRVLGFPVDEPSKMQWAEVVHPDDIERIAKMSVHIRSAPGTSGTGQFRMRHKEGGYRWMVARATNLLHHPQVRGVLSTFVDVTPFVEERESIQKQLERDARHDEATGLPNRRFLHEQLAAAIEATKLGGAWCLLFIDIDGFKLVNDSLGHDVGDRLVRAIAERMKPNVGATGTIFRFGGDELAVLLECDEKRGSVLANDLAASMRQPFTIDDRDVFVTVSVGVTAVQPLHARPEAVLADADVAMYRAKERGRDCVEIFDENLRVRSMRRHDMEQALRQALENDELRLVFQPKVLAAEGRLVGFEALLRWTSAKLGPVGPQDFIPLAEETGLIVPIGRFVLERACRELRSWKRRSGRLAGLKMSVNLSGRQLLGQEDFAAQVKSILEAYDVPPWDLELEVTESVLMTNAAKSIERLRQLKELGVKIAIDDFGTGYSSLSYLRKFPVDVIKVDRSFVTGLGTSREDSAIVHLIVTLAQALGLETVAEGVETDPQLAELRLLGCDQVQGYLVAQPLEVADAETFIERALGLEPRSIRAAAE
ncbi:MAG: GGDEF and EAL domain-containing protein [Myxococcales bacterium]|nr:GGDEF and EAL domain-containing protein [Myxococcales bacterium]